MYIYIYVYLWLNNNLYMEIYQAFCLDVAQGHMKGAPNETRTHSCRCTQ